MKRHNIELNFSRIDGLIPAIIQDAKSHEVLMLGYMNKNAFHLTLNTGFVHFWSRSRSKLWMKGEKSGNKLQVIYITFDCDQDTLLIKAKLIGKFTCHMGHYSCFFNNPISIRRKYEDK